MRSLLSANPNYLSLPRRTRGFPPFASPRGPKTSRETSQMSSPIPDSPLPFPSPSLPVMAQHVSDDELLWTGHVTGVFPGSFEYRYAVVDSDMNVVRWDAFAHTASFGGSHARLRGKEDRSPDRVEIYDTWEFQSHPKISSAARRSGTSAAPPGRATVSRGRIDHRFESHPHRNGRGCPGVARGGARARGCGRSRATSPGVPHVSAPPRAPSARHEEAARRSADGTANALSP